MDLQLLCQLPPQKGTGGFCQPQKESRLGLCQGGETALQGVLPPLDTLEYPLGLPELLAEVLRRLRVLAGFRHGQVVLAHMELGQIPVIDKHLEPALHLCHPGVGAGI